MLFILRESESKKGTFKPSSINLMHDDDNYYNIIF